MKQVERKGVEGEKKKKWGMAILQIFYSFIYISSFLNRPGVFFYLSLFVEGSPVQTQALLSCTFPYIHTAAAQHHLGLFLLGFLEAVLPAKADVISLGS